MQPNAPTFDDNSPLERRERRAPAAPTWGELVVESSWRPSDRPKVQAEGWLIANGYAPERRAR
jgi:hypothetical protein